MKKPIIILCAVALAFVYLSLFSYSAAGYGYSGYGGYHSGPSFWYFGSPHYYPSRSLRRTSVEGPGTRGGGLQYGK